jgi:hypothetical protein
VATTTQKTIVQATVKSRTAKAPAAKKPAVKKSTAQKSVTKKTAAKPVRKTAANKAPVKAATPKPTKPVKAVKPTKVKKPKLVRDSFTIPKDEYAVIDSLKVRAGKLGQAVKKSELLRAGIKALAAMSDIQFKATLSNVPTIKTGRPKSSK